MTLAAAKSKLRALVGEKLSSLLPEQIASQSARCTEFIVSSPEYQASKRIGIYLSMPTKEIDTTSLVEDAFRNGKKVFIPYTHTPQKSIVGEKTPPSRMDMLSLRSLEDFKTLKRNSWGIPTPPKSSISERENCLDRGISHDNDEFGLDLIIVPGVAFDHSCRRLGHGKGYYDFFFKRYQDSEVKKMSVLMAVALQEQILDEGEDIPVDETDWLVDLVVVGDGKIFKKEGYSN